MLIGAVQTFCQLEKWDMDLHSNDTKLDVAINKTVSGVKIDKYLKWDMHIDFLIKKLNSRVCLLREQKIDYSLQKIAV